MTNPDELYVTPLPKSRYGRVIREQGTRHIILGAVLLFIGWYVFDVIHTNQMNGVKWSAISAKAQGLVVLGLLDKDRAGRKAQFVARESNHSWQIRYREDAGHEDSEPDDSQSKSEKERGNSPVSAHGSEQGGVAPLEVLLKELPAVLNEKSFSGASIETGFEPLTERDFYKVHISLTDEGSSRYWQFSREHDGERLVFLLDGEVITCPRMQHMNTNLLTLEPVWVKADAARLADYINKHR